MTAALPPCRVCGSAVRTVLDLGTVPVGSCVLLSDPEAALRYPSGRLRLDACDACGFLQNGLFDETLVDYEHGYEESQASSPTFLAYTDELIDHLDRRYGLAGSTVLEPGCGKGEFLVRLCERTGSRGIGLDPAHVPGRVETAADVEFRQERFTAATAVDADLVVCRHTLEHIADVGAFTHALATVAGRTAPAAPVVVEVPESGRILDEGAFWDVYYEHASYFTASSLRTAAVAAGLEVDRLDGCFAGQYLVLEARPGSPATAIPGAEPGFTTSVNRFSERVAGSLDGWREMVATADRPVLWGASSKAVGFLSALGPTPIEAAVDINPYKHETYLAGSGVPVMAPEGLASLRPDLVIVMNPIYRSEIEAELADQGVKARVEVCQ